MKKLTKAELLIVEVNKAIRAQNELVKKHEKVVIEQMKIIENQTKLVRILKRSFATPVDCAVSIELPNFLNRHTN